MGAIKLEFNRRAVEEGCPVEGTEWCLADNHLLFLLYIEVRWDQKWPIGVFVDRVIGRENGPRERVGSDLLGANFVRITH